MAFVFFNVIALNLGYFQVSDNKRKLLKFSDVVLVFLFFISVEFVLFPFVAYAWISLQEGHLIPAHSFEVLYNEVKWFPLFGIILGSAAPLIYNYLTKKVAWGSLSNLAQDFRFALFSLILAIPAVMAISKLIESIFLTLGWGEQPDQLAVQLVKGSMQDPAYFIKLVIVISILVPLAEELMFRGYLQGFLIQKLSRWKAIFLTSACFVLFHFSPSQGYTNLTVLLSLFPLSCYLGFLRERQKSLWAPVTLHATFNMMSLMMLAAQGATP